MCFWFRVVNVRGRFLTFWCLIRTCSACLNHCPKLRQHIVRADGVGRPWGMHCDYFLVKWISSSGVSQANPWSRCPHIGEFFCLKSVQLGRTSATDCANRLTRCRGRRSDGTGRVNNVQLARLTRHVVTMRSPRGKHSPPEGRNLTWDASTVRHRRHDQSANAC